MLREMDIHGKIKDPPSWIMIETDPQQKAKKMKEKYSIEISEELKRTKSIASRKLGGPGRGKPRVTNFVAPATMFIKNEGFTPNEQANNTTKMLSTRVYKLANLGPDINQPGLVNNVYLIRQAAGKPRKEVAPWAQVYK